MEKFERNKSGVAEKLGPLYRLVQWEIALIILKKYPTQYTRDLEVFDDCADDMGEILEMEHVKVLEAFEGKEPTPELFESNQDLLEVLADKAVLRAKETKGRW
jgi:hypothetical protein